LDTLKDDLKGCPAKPKRVKRRGVRFRISEYYGNIAGDYFVNSLLNTVRMLPSMSHGIFDSAESQMFQDLTSLDMEGYEWWRMPKCWLRLLLVSIFLTSISSPINAEWIALEDWYQSHSLQKVYIDPASIHQESNLVEVAPVGWTASGSSSVVPGG